MILFSIFIYSLHLCFGYWILHRTLQQLKKKSYFPAFFLKLFIPTYCLVCVFLSYFFSNSVIWYLWVYAFGLIISIIEKLFSIYKRKQFYSLLLSFLNILILKIQLGSSFRASMIYATNRFNGHIKSQLEHILQYIILMHKPIRTNYPPYILNFIKALQFAEKNPHKALESLKQYQFSLVFANNLKKQYVDILYQIYAQSSIMSLLFLCLLIYVSLNYSIYDNLFLILSSVVLFFTGIVVILIYGKDLKWKF